MFKKKKNMVSKGKRKVIQNEVENIEVLLQSKQILDNIIDLLSDRITQVQRGNKVNGVGKRHAMLNDWLDRNCKNQCSFCENCLQEFNEIIETE